MDTVVVVTPAFGVIRPQEGSPILKEIVKRVRDNAKERGLTPNP